MKIKLTRRRLGLLYSGMGVIALAIYIVPNSTRLTRGLAVVIVLAAITLSAVWQWKQLWMKVALIAGVVIASWVAFQPARPGQPDELRVATVARWRSYEGTPYVWGGEGRYGIDCSGLIRRGLIEAQLRESLRTGNGALTRAAFALWWQDETAKEMGQGAKGLTRILGEADSLNGLPANQLLPGDIAVTRDGMHVLGYAGGSVWIEADPSEGKVVEVQLPSKIHWFNTPVTLVRWTVMK